MAGLTRIGGKSIVGDAFSQENNPTTEKQYNQNFNFLAAGIRAADIAKEGLHNPARNFEPFTLIIGRTKVTPSLSLNAGLDIDPNFTNFAELSSKYAGFSRMWIDEFEEIKKIYKSTYAPDTITRQVLTFGLQTDLTIESMEINGKNVDTLDNVAITEQDAEGNLPDQFNDVDTVPGKLFEYGTEFEANSYTKGPLVTGFEIVLAAKGIQKVEEERRKCDDVEDTWANWLMGVEPQCTTTPSHMIYPISVRFEIRYRRESDTTTGAPGPWVDYQHPPGRRPFDVFFSDDLLYAPAIRIGPLPPGTYTVQMRQTGTQPSEAPYPDIKVSLELIQMKFIQASESFKGQKLIGVSLKNYIPDKGEQSPVLTAIVSAKASKWVSGDTPPAPVETQNPAWWILWFLQGKRDDTGRLIYGCGLPVKLIDLESIRNFADFCDAGNYTSNMVIDRRMNRKQVLDAISRCGKGEIVWHNGKCGVVWDVYSPDPAHYFNKGNILKDSFSIHYTAEKLTDEIVVNFINEAKNWEPSSVRVKVEPDAIHINKPVNIDFFGCTRADKAAEHALLKAASQRLHRRRYTFTTIWEGTDVKNMETIFVNHDLLKPYHGGVVVRVLSDTEIELDDVLPQPGQIFFRLSDNTATEKIMIRQIAGARITLAKPVANLTEDGACLWFYGLRRN